MISMTNILAGTPFWVWIVFSYGIVIGTQGLSPRRIHLGKNLLITLFFIYLNISSLIHACAQFPSLSVVWLIATAIGATVGFYFLTRPPIEILANRYNLLVEGSAVFLIVFPILFAAKFSYGVLTAIAPDILSNIGFEIAFFTITGLCSGIMVGRTLCYLSHYLELNTGS